MARFQGSIVTENVLETFDKMTKPADIVPRDALFKELDKSVKNRWVKDWFDFIVDGTKIGACIEKLKAPKQTRQTR